jgi:hypothetical protein
MKACTFNFANQFTKFPGLRYIKQGPFSGELFRQKLEKLMAEHDRVTLDMNGVYGYGPSFLDEAFGILTDTHGKERVLTVFEIELDDNPLAKTLLLKAIDDHEAKRRSTTQVG